MATLTRSITVDAPVEKAFDYVLDPRKVWTVPDVAVADVVIKPEGVGTSARIWSHVLGFHIEGGLEYTEVVRPERIVIKVGFFMEHPTWTFAFEPEGGGTKVTAQGEWHVKAPAVGGTLERMMVKEHEPFLDSMLATLKAEVEGTVAA
jgi:uncharacterized protein YndB with AHSA1/START domain